MASSSNRAAFLALQQFRCLNKRFTSTAGELSKFQLERFPAGSSVRDVLASMHQRLDKTGVAYREGSFCAVDAGNLNWNLQQWRKHLPRVTPFYAIKCNQDPVIIRLLAALGAGFDCANKYEIDLALGSGGTPRNIIFAHPMKTPFHCRDAAERNVFQTTFDSEGELFKLKEHYPNVEAVVRIRAEDPDAAEPFGIKYGVDVPEAFDLIKLAKELEIKVVGVSFHSGYGLKNPNILTDAVAKCRAVYDMAKDVGVEMRLIDVGGGYPSLRGNKDDVSTFAELSEAVRLALDRYFPLDLKVRIIAEPGQYFARNVQHCALRIDGKRIIRIPRKVVEEHGAPRGLYILRIDERQEDLKTQRQAWRDTFAAAAATTTTTTDSESVPVVMYHLSHGAFSIFYECLFTEDGIEYDVHPLLPPNEDIRDPEIYSTFWGPILTSYDSVRVSKGFKMKLMEIGDWVYAESIGSYSTSWASVLAVRQPLQFFYYATEDHWDDVEKGLKFRA
ncbi:ornithine decarboxylase 1-like isoform X4 [Oscarella lobularis]|uniref:ornithine decarboxylase 1-like isoform X4 n=1 Tax=Oscarella lobularis TaxID=121494 RepID=UPI003313D787